MPSGGKGGKGGQASNADLQDDEDVMNRLYRKKIFGDWKATRTPKRQHGPMIFYDKSPAPPKK
jgi:hypothetical protein